MWRDSNSQVLQHVFHDIWHPIQWSAWHLRIIVVVKALIKFRQQPAKVQSLSWHVVSCSSLHYAIFTYQGAQCTSWQRWQRMSVTLRLDIRVCYFQSHSIRCLWQHYIVTQHPLLLDTCNAHTVSWGPVLIRQTTQSTNWSKRVVVHFLIFMYRFIHSVGYNITHTVLLYHIRMLVPEHLALWGRYQWSKFCSNIFFHCVTVLNLNVQINITDMLSTTDQA